jgi:predicted site-specific integrase-resolvase
MTEVLKTRDVLDRFRISRPTLRRWLKRGEFPPPFHALGRRMWRRDDVEAFERRRLP